MGEWHPLMLRVSFAWKWLHIELLRQVWVNQLKGVKMQLQMCNVSWFQCLVQSTKVPNPPLLCCPSLKWQRFWQFIPIFQFLPGCPIALRGPVLTWMHLGDVSLCWTRFRMAMRSKCIFSFWQTPRWKNTGCFLNASSKQFCVWCHLWDLFQSNHRRTALTAASHPSSRTCTTSS